MQEIVGIRRLERVVKVAFRVWRKVVVWEGVKVLRSFKSAPAQNTPPTPDSLDPITKALVSPLPASAAIASISSRKALRRSQLSAFLAVGRLSNKTRMEPRWGAGIDWERMRGAEGGVVE